MDELFQWLPFAITLQILECTLQNFEENYALQELATEIQNLIVSSIYRFNSTISFPRAKSTMLAIPMNSPCSTTPGISLN